MEDSSPKPTYAELVKENAALRLEVARLRQLYGNLKPVSQKPKVLFSGLSDPGSNIPSPTVGPLGQPPAPAEVTTPAQTAAIPEALPQLTPQTASQPEYRAPTLDVALNDSASLEAKIQLFLSLFAGRTDVYAKRFVIKRNNQAGYAPVCANEWKLKLCQKPKVKCAVCPAKEYSPLTPQVIQKHLAGLSPSGEDVIGVYPMLIDETCRFLAADFDDKNWPQDILAFQKAARERGLELAIERSRSGQGAHAWFFFAEPIPASLARRLGSGLLTAAMETRHDLNFSSYDRFLPNQDTMPKGGLGNLIALPLQGQAKRNQNSLFIDETFNPYPDQWAYLAGLKKIPLATVESVVSQLALSGGDLGVLAPAAETDKPKNKPWERTTPPVPLVKSDFPASVNLIRANGIYLPKEGCSERGLSRVKRLAAFKNPEFFKKQAMRLSTYNLPRIICPAWETDEWLCLPRGLEGELIGLLAGLGVTVSIDDLTEEGSKVPVVFTGELREEQALAAKDLIAHHNGVLAAATAFGKTIIAAYLIAQRRVNALIIVQTQALMNQWQEALTRFLRLEDPLADPSLTGASDFIGQYGGGQKDLTGLIDIAIVASLAQEEEVKPWVKDYGLVIVDECHHVAAFRHESVLKEVKARWVYGLSATPLRQDGHHPIVFQQLGPIRHQVSSKVQALTQGFTRILIPRFTKFQKPLEAPDNWAMTDIYAELAKSPSRLNLIVNDVVEALKRGRTPLVLSERVEYGQELTEKIQEAAKEEGIFFLSGRGTAKEKRETLAKVRSHPKDQPLAIVATGKYVGEGFDEPRLDALFVALPIAWKGTVAQYAGRLHRLCSHKTEVLIYDYVDAHVPVLERMYHKRLAAYASLGYSPQRSGQSPGQSSGERIAAIFNQEDYLEPFTQDIALAKKEIVIASPYFAKARLQEIKPRLVKAQGNGVKVIIVAKAPEPGLFTSFVEEMAKDLEQAGLKVVFQTNGQRKYAIIDRRLVWYGDISLLAEAKSEETMMRLDNRDIALELMEDLALPPEPEKG
ncbi:MAG: DEAD/DEAH box helicase family protein [Deltaproteobacteria bacterium]|jgi:superfamily II DNA or RNA helicase|nr:DEAD/DEAH box helicase family protein [Deltaproteobacteria bacterium]